MLINRPIWTQNALRLRAVILAMLDKLDGYENIGPMWDHFNRVVQEVKTFCKDPRNARRFDSETYELAMRMAGNEDLKRIIMKIDTIDDVDKDIANRILKILEPTFARPEPTKKSIA